jgi:hypothetical protein
VPINYTGSTRDSGDGRAVAQPVSRPADPSTPLNTGYPQGEDDRYGAAPTPAQNSGQSQSYNPYRNGPADPSVPLGAGGTRAGGRHARPAGQ